jgi:RecB family exonuclease
VDTLGDLPSQAATSPSTFDQSAQIRVRILDEIDPVRGSRRGESTHAGLGPYFGFVGEVGDSDPRGRQELYVTTLEALSRCPWKTFLQRILRIEPLPDPLEILPAVSPLMVGGLVHRVLEAIVEPQLPTGVPDLAAARRSPGTAVSWPGAADYEDVLRREAEQVVREHGIGLAGLAGILAKIAAPHLQAAHDLEWADGNPVPAVDAEWSGDLEVADDRGTRQRLRFKADRLDSLPSGLRLSDYKTGKQTISSAATPGKRRSALRRAIASGAWLQAAAYAVAAGESGDSGRYLFLTPALAEDPELREVVVQATDQELVSAFQSAAATLLGVWQRGHFFPRLMEVDRSDSEPFHCSYCSVAEACLRGDSGARARLRQWVEPAIEEQLAGAQQLSADDRALVAAWLLPSKRRASTVEPQESAS